MKEGTRLNNTTITLVLFVIEISVRHVQVQKINVHHVIKDNIFLIILVMPTVLIKPMKISSHLLANLALLTVFNVLVHKALIALNAKINFIFKLTFPAKILALLENSVNLGAFFTIFFVFIF